ncbi:tetratricopeptide repeat protein [Methylibium petroleiphilum]|uniref:tetratricopeptide repeat protein n=1 Tax=Methylibium petroleiphilum TaxID=105560 RepID=UPI001ACEF1D6|nr:tetratricopeptide repeat protein [Methylibium petroleiphilum]MBN9203331.1 tetratricopeptide repeat protein [Methylibium petroleiphilum]
MTPMLLFFLLLAAALCLAAIATLTRPLWRTAPTSPPADGTATAGPPRRLGLTAALAVFSLVIVGGGYGWLGAPGLLDLGPGSQSAAAPPPAAASGAGGDPARAQIAAMVDQLAERLKSRPDDAEGWQMLSRSYAALGRHAEAVDAYRKAVALNPRDPSLLVDLGASLVALDRDAMHGEPTRLVERALALDPAHPKALAFAGLIAFDRKDYATAVKHWEALARVEPADSPFAQQIRASVAQARQLAGLPPAADAAPAVTPAASSPPLPTGAPARVSGTVRLAPSLKDRVAPEDTLFVFARAAGEGAPRMPLAILRRQAKDLPLQFTLDDSLSMSPAARLSGATQVVVGARLSRSGDAMPQPGDLQGLSAAVAVGTTGLQIEIGEPAAK